MRSQKIKKQPLLPFSEQDPNHLHFPKHYQNIKFYGFVVIVIVLLIITFVFLLLLNLKQKNFCAPIQPKSGRSLPEGFLADKNNLRKYKIHTFKGDITLEEANNDIFIPLGYQIVQPKLPVPTLKYLRTEPTCGKIYSDSLRSSSQLQPENPRKISQSDMTNEFLLKSFTALRNVYRNENLDRKNIANWDKFRKMMEQNTPENGNFNEVGMSMYNAMKNNKIRNKNGIVLESVTPWVEIYALLNGAKHVLTVGHNNVEIQKEFVDRMKSIRPTEFARNLEKYVGTFDFAASFPSIEYSGVGDPIDPIEDSREMAKIKCLLKPGGLLFLGFYLQTDLLLLDLIQTYGSLQLAMMFTGFEVIGTYTCNQSSPVNQDFSNVYQHTLVLKKL